MFLFKQTNTFKITFNINYKIKTIYELYKLSYPIMFSMFVDYIGNFVMFYMISYYLGKESMAAGRLSFTLLLLAFAIITSFSSGFMILGGRALGKNNISIFKKYYVCNKNMLFCFAIILSLLIIIIPNYLINYLTAFKVIKQESNTPIFLVAIICPFIAISYSNASCLRLMEKVKEDMYSNMFALWIVQLPLAYYWGVYKKSGLIGFFLALLVYEIIYSLTTHIYKVKNYKTFISKLGNSPIKNMSN